MHHRSSQAIKKMLASFFVLLHKQMCKNTTNSLQHYSYIRIASFNILNYNTKANNLCNIQKHLTTYLFLDAYNNTYIKILQNGEEHIHHLNKHLLHIII